MRREFPASTHARDALRLSCDNAATMNAAAALPARSLASLRRELLGWYRANRRDLPWRRSHDPYRIWVAEIMLQQTRIAAVLPYYEGFLKKFPSLRALACARESEVLKRWAGLGYYSRARNLHRTARKIAADQGGHFPTNLKSVLALPGIGQYTAAAILSIAFNAPLAALDGNVARVLARLFAIRGDLRAPTKWKRLATIAQKLIPGNSAGDWNQALMELGETICTPRLPQCARCPAATHCQARALNLADRLPAPRRKPKAVRVRIAAAVLLDQRGRTLLKKSPGRHDSGIFSGLWQFPAVTISSRNGRADAELRSYLRDSIALTPDSLVPLPPVTHTVTFRQITIVPFLTRVNSLPRMPGCRTAILGDLNALAASSATKKIARTGLRALSEVRQ